MYRDDGLTVDDMLALLRAFPGQTLDFFGALRCASTPVLLAPAPPLPPACPLAPPSFPHSPHNPSRDSTLLCLRRSSAPRGCSPCPPPCPPQGLHVRRPDTAVDQAGRDPRRDPGWATAVGRSLRAPSVGWGGTAGRPGRGTCAVVLLVGQEGSRGGHSKGGWGARGTRAHHKLTQ